MLRYLLSLFLLELFAAYLALALMELLLFLLFYRKQHLIIGGLAHDIEVKIVIGWFNFGQDRLDALDHVLLLNALRHRLDCFQMLSKHVTSNLGHLVERNRHQELDTAHQMKKSFRQKSIDQTREFSTSII